TRLIRTRVSSRVMPASPEAAERPRRPLRRTARAVPLPAGAARQHGDTRRLEAPAVLPPARVRLPRRARVRPDQMPRCARPGCSRRCACWVRPADHLSPPQTAACGRSGSRHTSRTGDEAHARLTREPRARQIAGRDAATPLIFAGLGEHSREQAIAQRLGQAEPAQLAPWAPIVVLAFHEVLP